MAFTHKTFSQKGNRWKSLPTHPLIIAIVAAITIIIIKNTKIFSLQPNGTQRFSRREVDMKYAVFE